MASSMLCDPCQVQDKQSEASEWCPDCEESLCSGCSSHHRSSKASRSHHLVNISALFEIPSRVTSEEVCYIHDQLQVEYFCTYHDEMCCRACLADKHRTCNDIAAIDSACKKAKSFLLENTKTETKHIIETLELINKDIEKSSTEVGKKSQKMKKEISDAKNDAFNRLEETEKALVDEIDNKTNDIDFEAKNKSDKIRDLMEISTDKLKQIEFVEKHGTDKQAFYLAHKFKMFMKEIEAPLAEVISINSMTLEFVKSQPPANNVLLGTISKSKQTKQVTKYSSLKQKPAQFTVEKNKLLTSFLLSKQFETQCTNVLGMIATDDGKLLLCNNRSIDPGGGVYVYHQTGQYIKRIELNNTFDITYIKSTNQFAVTLTSSKLIAFICRKTLEYLNTIEIKCKENPYAIAATDTQFYISTCGEMIVMHIDKLPNGTKMFEYSNLSCYVQTNTKDVYVSCADAISTLDKSKKFEFPDGEPMQIIIDKHGYVYVAVYVVSGPSYIQRLTPDLKPDIKINIDGGIDMWTICFNEDFSKLFWAKNRGQSIVTVSCSLSQLRQITEGEP